MINLAGLGSLFFEQANECREPNAVRVRHLFDASYEPEYQRLETEGRPMRWVSETRLLQHSQQGWRPVSKRDCTGCPTVFMDRAGDLVLLYQAGKCRMDEVTR